MRQNYHEKHPTNCHAVPIVKVSKKIILTAHGRTYTFKRTQFPIVLAYAITSHSAQGITKEKVIIDYGLNKAKHALFSVLFSRVKTLNGIFLKKFKKKYFYCDARVIEEYEHLETRVRYKFDNTYLYYPCFYNLGNTENMRVMIIYFLY